MKAICLAVVLLVINGCGNSSPRGTSQGVSSADSAARVSSESSQLRQRPNDLRQLADQLDQEAATGATTPVVPDRKRALAQELRQEAEAQDKSIAEREPSTNPAVDPLTGVDGITPQRAAIHERHYYRQLADQLRQMAERRRIEAQLLARQSNVDATLIAQKQQLSEDLDAIATEAEKRAREAEKHIPHGMVPQ